MQKREKYLWGFLWKIKKALDFLVAFVFFSDENPLTASL